MSDWVSEMPFYLRQIEPIDVGRNFTAGKNDESKHKLVDSQEEAVNRFVGVRINVAVQPSLRASAGYSFESSTFPELCPTSYASLPASGRTQVIYLVH